MTKRKEWGLLFSGEGGDGSGKTRQVAKLGERYQELGYAVKTWDFPQYGDSFYGRMAGRMQNGEFGALMSIHPLLAATVYANDRLSVRNEIAHWLERGGVAICNRYVDSNLAHGGAKFTDQKQALAYIQEIEQLEFGENRMPYPTATFYLATDAELSARLTMTKGERLYMNGEAMDQAEKDMDHQKKAREMYEHLCQTRERFIRIECMKGKGEIETIETIHERIWREIVAHGWT